MSSLVSMVAYHKPGFQTFKLINRKNGVSGCEFYNDATEFPVSLARGNSD